jgi:hypothetical protein
MSVSHDSQVVRQVAPPARSTPEFLGRLKGMLIAPKAEFAQIAAAGTATSRIYTGFVMPLALLDALIGFIHVSIVGTAEPLTGTVRVPVTGGLLTALLVFAFGLLGIGVVAWVIDALAPFFGAVPDRRLASATAAYASTPIWLATVLVPFPTVWAPVEVLAVMYHTWLLYVGLRVLMRAARDRVLGYATTVVLCTILLEIVFTMASTALSGGTHMNPYRAFG